MKETINALAILMIWGSFFAFGYWSANNKDKPMESFFYGAVSGGVSGVGFLIKRESEK